MIFLAVEASNDVINFTAIIVAAIGAVGAVLSYIQANHVRREQRRMDTKKVDAEAYERARKFDKEVVESLRAEIDRLNKRLREEQEVVDELRRQLIALDDLQRQVVALREALDNEKSVSKALRDQVVALENRVMELKNQLARFTADHRSSDMPQGMGPTEDMGVNASFAEADARPDSETDGAGEPSY